MCIRFLLGGGLFDYNIKHFMYFGLLLKRLQIMLVSLLSKYSNGSRRSTHTNFFFLPVMRITRVWVEKNNTNIHPKRGKPWVLWEQMIQMWPSPFLTEKDSWSVLSTVSHQRIINSKLMIKSFSRFIIKLNKKRERKGERKSQEERGYLKNKNK